MKDYLILILIGTLIAITYYRADIKITDFIKQSEKMQLELVKKYPECLEACRPRMCFKYKRKLERLNNENKI